MMAAVLASSSGSVRIWVNPSPAGDIDIEPSSPGAPSRSSQPTGDGADSWPWLGALFNVIGIVLLVFLVAVFVHLAVIPRNPWVRSRLRRWSLRRPGHFEALPEVDDRELDLDMAAARLALAAGTPRNAIVACWIQLEGDATEVGLPRLDAETSVEYTQRVVASSSIDPGPIGELAALYREARFSGHRLEDDHRTRAFAALGEVERFLDSVIEAER
jgi:hypothetical protein